MSNGLGTTVPLEGEPGSVTHAVPIQPETIPDKPQTISQTTAIQTLDQLLNQNWIYDSTFTASTNMPAGTVLYVKPIHPQEWNWPNRIVSGMFNTWTGSGKVRYRPLATAWYGGSIRVGFIPPNITQTQIRNMPLEVLTSYPNRDIDPKNTMWVDFRGPDQREIAYHYMAPFDDQDRQNFGGYIIFYIAGKLVTQAPEFTTIQFILESAGDFMYDQPSPTALQPAADMVQPLGSNLTLPIAYQSLTDSCDTGYYNAIQILPVTITSLKAGGFGMSAIGLPNAVGKLDSLQQGASSPLYLTYHQNSSWSVEVGETSETIPIKMTPNAATKILPHINTEMNSSVQMGLSVYQANGSVNYTYLHPSGLELSTIPPDGTLDMKVIAGSVTATDKKIGSSATIVRDFDVTTTNPVDPSACNTDLTLSPIVGGESIVAFVNLHARTIAPQTMQMAYNLGRWRSDDSKGDTSYLYNLISSTGTPIALIRLNPNGMFTTNAVTTTVVYPGTVSMRFFGTLPVDTPLPPMSVYQRSIRASAMRALKGAKHLEEGVSSLISEFSLY